MSSAVAVPDTRYYNLPNLPHIDVRAYGALVDGTTDDLAAVNLALAALSASRSVLLFPAGTCKLSAAPTLPALDNIRIVGQGRYKTILDFRTSATGGLKWDGSARRLGIGVEHVQIQGKLTAVTDLTNANPGTNTQVSSATYSFVGGETLYIRSGTNVTPGYYTIGSASGGVGTLNTAYASGASSNGSAYIYPSAMIGLDFNEVDESYTNEVHITGWDIGMRVKTNTFGAYFNNHYHPRIVNCGKGVYLTGTQGSNEQHFFGGHMDVNAIGILIDTPSSGVQLHGTGFQSNAEAISTNGQRGNFTGIHLEGNTHDITFNSSAVHNRILTGFLDNTKIADNSAAKANRFPPYGHAATPASEPLQTIMSYDFRLVTNASQVIGVQYGSVSHRFQVYEGRWVTSMSFEPSVAAGNVDCAIVDAISAAVVASSGPVAVGTANSRQTVNFTSPGFLYPGGTYYMCVLFDDATAALYGFAMDSRAQIMSVPDGLVKKKTMANGTVAGQNLIASASTATFMYALQVA